MADTMANPEYDQADAGLEMDNDDDYEPPEQITALRCTFGSSTRLAFAMALRGNRLHK